MFSSLFHGAANSKYDTPRVLRVHNKKVTTIFWLLRLIIIGYIFGCVIIGKKGYQKFDMNVQSAVTTKLKGAVYANETLISGFNGRTWDSGDYAIPSKENGAFFVLTNVLVTPHQKQGVCEESSCPGLWLYPLTPHLCIELAKLCGVATGRCINSMIEIGAKVCEIRAWCPVERDDELGRHNLPAATKNNLSSCRYNPNSSTDKFCPIFTLKSIVSGTGHTFESMVKQGGVIQIIINWDCNLDFSKDDCLPSYSFRRLDRHALAISRGHNFRYAMHYMKGDNIVRTLYKAYGIRFVITVGGKAGKFNIVPLVLEFAACLALSIAPYVCDFIVKYVLTVRAWYMAKKYLDDREADAYEHEMGDICRKEAGSENSAYSESLDEMS